MDIERANAVLNKAILNLQIDESEAMFEAMAQGVTSYDVPMPGEVRGRVKQRDYKALVVDYLKRNRLKVNKTQLRKLLKRHTDRSFWKELGSSDIHAGFLHDAITELIDETKTVKDYKRELAKLEKEQHRDYKSKERDVPGRHAVARKAHRSNKMDWRARKMDVLKDRIAELGG